MIQKDRFDYFVVVCDACGEDLGEDFDTFKEAVAFKRTAAKEMGWRSMGWRSVKDKNNRWHTLCPGCATPEFIRRLKENV